MGGLFPLPPKSDINRLRSEYDILRDAQVEATKFYQVRIPGQPGYKNLSPDELTAQAELYRLGKIYAAKRQHENMSNFQRSQLKIGHGYPTRPWPSESGSGSVPGPQYSSISGSDSGTHSSISGSGSGTYSNGSGTSPSYNSVFIVPRAAQTARVAQILANPNNPYGEFSSK